MATFMTSMSILAFRNDIVINTLNIDSISLCDDYKTAPESYSEDKKEHSRSRLLRSKNHPKHKDNFKELEQVFSNHRCVHVQWGVREPLLLFFNSGTIATIQLDERKTAIEKIIIDNSLCGKLYSDHITSVVFCEHCLLISYSEPKLTYIHFSKNSPSFPNKLLGNKKSKIVGFDPHISTVELPGSSSRRLEKKLSLNNLKDCVLVWWRFTCSDVWPWMPVNHSIDRINLLVYSLNGTSIDILCSTKVHGELQYASFSRWHSNRILTLEEVTEGDQYTVNICTYEVSRGRCQCTSLLKLPLQSRMTAFDWTASEDKLLLSDQDMSLLVYDLNSNTTLVTSTMFAVKEIVWHPDGMIACVISSNGSLQCFDAALTPLKFQVSSESLLPLQSINLHSVLYPQKNVQKITWQNYNLKQNLCGVSDTCNVVSDALLVYFETGVLIFINFSLGCITKNLLTPLELISQYLKSDSIDEAVCLLQCLNWCQQSELCFQCLSKIVNFLLRRPLSLRTESAVQLSLGTFYDSVSTLPETVLYDYHQQVDHIARRFFHQLLRYHRFEKAYLLAVNLQSRNLFLDLHHVAKEKGEMMLSIVSFKQAEQLDVSGGSSCDQSDSSEGSVQESSSVSSSESKTLKSIEGCPLLSTSSPTSNSFNRNSSRKERFSLNGTHLEGDLFLDTKEINANPATLTSPLDFNVAGNYARNKRIANPAITEVYAGSNAMGQHKYDITRAEVNLHDSSDMLLHAELPSIINHKLNLISTNNSRATLSENFEEEEEDLEGARVKFVHFGIV